MKAEKIQYTLLVLLIIGIFGWFLVELAKAPNETAWWIDPNQVCAGHQGVRNWSNGPNNASEAITCIDGRAFALQP